MNEKKKKELEPNSKNKCMKDLYRSMTESKKDYQLKTW
jgi:hypothetical protein